ncbi:MAG TPA: copper-binding protein [Candidatus Udaeobacter sp.]|jgi:Cu/Ag efflux protein CusF|nr:copper-binding protein [Candidatus Udaeobacter sp.]
MKSLDIFVGILSLSLLGCAVYEIPPLGENHPAYVGKMPLQERTISKTLAYTRADIPSPRPMVDPASAQQGGHKGQHAEGSAQNTVTGEGKVVATVPSSSQLVVDHGEIKGFMGAMTMGYPVEPPSQLEGLKPGDQVRFTIDIPKKAIVKIEKFK